MKVMRKFVFFFLFALCFSGAVHANEGDCERFFNEFNVVGEKVYVQPEQVLISNGGILIQGQELSLLVNQLNYNLNGIYFLKGDVFPQPYAYGQCPNGHERVCDRCRGCNGWSCQYRCKCRR